MDSAVATRCYELWLDVGSAYSYIAWKSLPAFVARTGAAPELRPMLLGGVFRATGNRSPVEVAAKARWAADDLARWAARLSVPFSFNPWFPVNTIGPMRGAIALRLRAPHALPHYLDAMFDAMWGSPCNLADPQTLAAVAARAGIDAAQFAAMIEDPQVKDALRRDTEEAVARGVFGAPTFFVGEAMFFGQDRMEFVAEALAAR